MRESYRYEKASCVYYNMYMYFIWNYNLYFAEKVIDEINKTDYFELENYEKDFLDFYIKQIIFDESSQEVLAYDPVEHYENVTNVYKANYNNEYSDKSRTLLIRFENNLKSTDIFEYYAC